MALFLEALCSWVNIAIVVSVENIARVSSAAVNTRLVCCYLAVPVLLFLPVLLLRIVQSYHVTVTLKE